MTDVFVGKIGDLQKTGRKIVKINGIEIGVFKVENDFYAYENMCIHQGGPVCEGEVIGKVEQILSADQEIIEEKFSDEVLHIVCPWHGWEFDIRTGECAGDKKLKLKSYSVSIRGDEVYVNC